MEPDFYGIKLNRSSGVFSRVEVSMLRLFVVLTVLTHFLLLP